MIPVLYEKDRTTFENNGLGGLPHALSCTVTREANKQGGHYLNMEYPVEGLHFGDIQEERLIYAAPAPHLKPQPFRISRIVPEGKKAVIEAPHVSAQLQKITTYGVESGTNIEGQLNTLLWRAGQLGQTTGFWLTTDITREGITTFNYPEPSSVADILLGEEGSVLDMLGGEYEFDGWHIILHKQKGRNTPFEIRAGVNITSVRVETDDSSLVTAVLPYYKTEQNGQDVFVYGSLCKASSADDYQITRCVPLDVSENFSDLEEGTLPTAEQVTAQGQAFITGSASSVLRTSYEVQFVPTTPDIPNVNPAPKRIHDLFDRWQVVLPEYGIKATARIEKTVHNVLLNRYDSVTIGVIQRNAADTIAALIKNTGNQKILW